MIPTFGTFLWMLMKNHVYNTNLGKLWSGSKDSAQIFDWLCQFSPVMALNSDKFD